MQPAAGGGRLRAPRRGAGAGCEPRPQPRPKQYSRAEVRARYGWSDGDLNYAMDSKILSRAIPSYETAHLGGPVVNVYEKRDARAIEKLDEIIERLFPSALPRRSMGR